MKFSRSHPGISPRLPIFMGAGTNKRYYGWFVARALHEGGTQVEDDRPDTLAEALAALEAGLARWFEERASNPTEGPP